MKTLIMMSLFLSFAALADAVNLSALKNLMTARQSQLETASVGMSKKVVTTSSIDVDGADCRFTQTALQSILRIEGDKLIVLSQESFVPESSDACSKSGYSAYTENILFYEAKPSLKADLAELDAGAADIQNVQISGSLVTLSINGQIQDENGRDSTELVTVKYDMSKSSFRNLTSTQGAGYAIITTDQPDIDLNKVDLKNVLFCSSADSKKDECMQGDFSDILF